MTTKALKDATPYEMWIGRKPQVDNLRVFGCRAHARATGSHLQKLDDRSKRLVHLGCEIGIKAYRLFDLDTGKICISRDVCFQEGKAWS